MKWFGFVWTIRCIFDFIRDCRGCWKLSFLIENLKYRIRMYKAWCEEKCTAQGTLWRWAIFAGIKKDFSFHIFAYEFAGREFMQGFLDGMNQMETFLEGTGLFTLGQRHLLGNPEFYPQPIIEADIGEGPDYDASRRNT